MHLVEVGNLVVGAREKLGPGNIFLGRIKETRDIEQIVLVASPGCGLVAGKQVVP